MDSISIELTLNLLCLKSSLPQTRSKKMLCATGRQPAKQPARACFACFGALVLLSDLYQCCSPLWWLFVADTLMAIWISSSRSAMLSTLVRSPGHDPWAPGPLPRTCPAKSVFSPTQTRSVSKQTWHVLKKKTWKLVCIVHYERTVLCEAVISVFTIQIVCMQSVHWHL